MMYGIAWYCIVLHGSDVGHGGNGGHGCHGGQVIIMDRSDRTDIST